MAGPVDVTAMAKPATAAMVERLLPHLRCPLTLIRQGHEVPLTQRGEALVSPNGHAYAVVAGVPDLRPRASEAAGETIDHYAHIHAARRGGKAAGAAPAPAHGDGADRARHA